MWKTSGWILGAVIWFGFVAFGLPRLEWLEWCGKGASRNAHLLSLLLFSPRMVIAALGFYFKPLAFAAWERWFLKISLPTTMLSGLATFIFASIGFGMAEGGGWEDCPKAAYETAQLFQLNLDNGSFLEDDASSGQIQMGVPGFGSVHAILEVGLDKQSHKFKHASLAIAMLASVVFTISLSFRAILFFFRESFDALILGQTSRHVVVCGLGPIGREIVRNLTADADEKAIRTNSEPLEKTAMDVVVIESNAEDLDVGWARQRGAIVLIGDATSSEMLKRAGVPAAKEIFVVTGRDEVNVEVVVEVSRTMSDPAVSRRAPFLRRNAPLHCHAHVLSGDLADILRERSEELEKPSRATGDLSSPTEPKRLELDIFNAIERTARNLVVDLCTRGLTPSSDGEVSHYFILGFGEFGQSFVVQLSQMAHFGNHLRPRFTILDEKIEKAIPSFRARYPGFCDWDAACPGTSGEVAPFRTVDDAWSIEPNPDSLARPIRGACYVANVRFVPYVDVAEHGFVKDLIAVAMDTSVRAKPAVFVCLEDDHKNFALGDRLKRALERVEGVDFAYGRDGTGGNVLPIFTWLPQQSHLADLCRPKSIVHKEGVTLIPFGECSGSASYLEIVAHWSEWLAAWLHFGYEMARCKETPKSDELQALWNSFRRAAGLDSDAIVPAANRLQMLFHERQALQRAVNKCWRTEKPEWHRASSRSAATHAVVKLANLGLKIEKTSPDIETKQGPSTGPAELWKLSNADSRIDDLCRVEHARYLAERLMSGWRYGEARDDVRRLHPHLVAWEDLGRLEDGAVAVAHARESILLLIGLCRLGFLVTEPLKLGNG